MNYKMLLLSLFLFSIGCGPAPQSHELVIADSAGILNGTKIEERTSTASKGVVLIEMIDLQSRVVGLCTGTLISEETVLTAAHCFDKTLIRGFAGFRLVFTNDYMKERQNAVRRRGLRFANNGSYNSSGQYDHDIAIGTFAGGIPEGFAAVDYDQDTDANYGNATVYVYGYGKHLDYSGATGEIAWKNVGVLYRGVLKIVAAYNLAADRYFTDPKVDTYICSGDSGGPQFYHEDGVLKVIGVNSAHWGEKLNNGFSSCKGRGQVTKVAPFASWIQKTRAKLLTN